MNAGIRYTYLFFIGCFLFTGFWASAQITVQGEPASFSYGLEQLQAEALMPALNMRLINQENAIREQNGKNPAVGEILPADLKPSNAGQWTNLPGGGKIWRLKVSTDDALATTLYFDGFNLPEGGLLWVYTEDHREVTGAFSHLNNPDNGIFSTGMIDADHTIVEYFVPDGISTNEDPFRIKGVGHAYRGVPNQLAKGFGDSDPCQVNANCAEGDNWEDQKNSVARIIVVLGAQQFLCTGSVVNNTSSDCTPYFLTAWHCAEGVTNADLANWVFYFNYEAPGCSNPASEAGLNNEFLVGATMRSNSADGGGNSGSDFLLIELTSNIPNSYNVYYAGWDRGNASSSSGTSIHHPSGDIMKISTYSSNLLSTSWGGTVAGTHWRVVWNGTSNGHGVTEGGSSGSAIYGSNGLIKGTLTGGGSFCTSTGSPDAYGKLSYSWASNGTQNNRRLSPWLDPVGSGQTTLQGVYFPCVVAANDAGITQIISPNGSVCGSTFTPEVTIRNFGTLPLTSVEVGYRINAGPDQLVGPFTGSLPPGASTTVTLPPIPTPNSSFTFEAYTVLPNNTQDGNNANNQSSTFNSIVQTFDPPFVQAFEFPIFPPSGMQVFNPDNDDFEWDLNTGVGQGGFGSSDGAAKMNNYDGTQANNPRGTSDWLLLPVLDLSNTFGTSMTFDLAHADFAGSSTAETDSLILAYSVDCGETFQEVWRAGGPDLETAPATTDPFIPTANDWQTFSFNLDVLDDESSVQIALINVSDWGNDTYIDNINFSFTSTDVEDPIVELDLNVFPNPSNGRFNVQLAQASASELQIEVFNSVGQQVYQENGSWTNLERSIDLSDQATGVYFLRVQGEGVLETRRVVILD
ncbi:MAG: T9SS type A sorting domain-containing protein [Bacteroidota bacterium]